MNASRDNDIISSRRERKREKGSNQTCVVIILDPLLSLSLFGEGEKEISSREGRRKILEKDFIRLFDPRFN